MNFEILQGDSLGLLRRIPEKTVQCCVTSPPYWGLRAYQTEPQVWDGNPEHAHEWGATQTAHSGQFCACGAWRGELGLEPSPELYVAHLVAVFREVRRVLRDDGTLWLNLGDSYATGGGAVGRAPGGGEQGERFLRAGMINTQPNRMPIPGLKPKDLVGIPWRVAFALQADGWWLRSDIVWRLSGGTRVYARTQRGDAAVTLKDLARLDPATVKLWNGLRWTQVLGWSETPRAVQLEIKLRSGERIGCTAHHQWPTGRGLIRTDALVVGDVLAVRGLPEPDEGAEAPAHIPDEIGWFVGLYVAEGSRSGKTIQIAGDVREAKRHARLAAIARTYGATLAIHNTVGYTCTANLDRAEMLSAIIARYVGGRTAHDKHLKPACWRRANAFLAALLQGYLDGDGHHDPANRRWRLAFTRNDGLASDLRTIGARSICSCSRSQSDTTTTRQRSQNLLQERAALGLTRARSKGGTGAGTPASMAAMPKRSANTDRLPHAIAAPSGR